MCNLSENKSHEKYGIFCDSTVINFTRNILRIVFFCFPQGTMSCQLSQLLLMFYGERNIFSAFVTPQGYKHCTLVRNTEVIKKCL